MKLWLDDIREAPEGWVWVKSVQEAIRLLESERVEEASLDHDLGEGVDEGYALLLWMAEHNVWPERAISVHSSNPPGVKRMCSVIERYGPYRKVAPCRYVRS